jgi:hypothetical protein
MIEAVSFGSITIDGKTYTSDLLRFPDGRVADAWRRHAGHRLSMADIATLVAAGPEVIVAGCGVSGRMVPDADLAGALAELGIDFFAAANGEAAERFNRHCGRRKTGACFHLTC